MWCPTLQPRANCRDISTISTEKECLQIALRICTINPLTRCMEENIMQQTNIEMASKKQTMRSRIQYIARVESSSGSISVISVHEEFDMDISYFLHKPSRCHQERE